MSQPAGRALPPAPARIRHRTADREVTAPAAQGLDKLGPGRLVRAATLGPGAAWTEVEDRLGPAALTPGDVRVPVR